MAHPLRQSTLAARAGINQDPTFGAVVPPLHLSANYSFAAFGERRRYDYARSGNPTRDLLADTLSELEGGAGAVVTGAGMSALDLVLSLARPGELILAPHDCYGGSHRLISERARRGAFRAAFVDQGDQAALDRAFAEAPRLVLVETPSNPLLRVVDIAALAARAKAAGAKLVVDNTFLSPALQRPIALGADFVVHSTTKYLNGHSDLIGGAVITADAEAAAELAWWANCTGVTGSAFDSFLTLRGLRTLFPRLEWQGASALRLAEVLAAHPAVAEVFYPGLPDHPGHTIAKTQQAGFGAMLSFRLRGGLDNVRTLIERLELFTLAESLGGVESLIAHPATMTHAAMDVGARQAAGITDSLLRLSIGLEHEDDLLRDLIGALDALARPTALGDAA